MPRGRLHATTVQNQRKKFSGVTSVSNVKFLHAWVCAKSLQLCPTLCGPVDCSPPSSSVSGILQARILDWVAMPSSRESSRPRNRTHISCFLHWYVGSLPLVPPRKPKFLHTLLLSHCIWANINSPFPWCKDTPVTKMKWTRDRVQMVW